MSEVTAFEGLFVLIFGITVGGVWGLYLLIKRQELREEFR